MSAGGYDAFDDPHVYKGTDVRKSRLGIRDQVTLGAFDVEGGFAR